MRAWRFIALRPFVLLSESFLRHYRATHHHSLIKEAMP